MDTDTPQEAADGAERPYTVRLRQSLAILATFADELSSPGFEAGTFVAGRDGPGGSFQIGYSSLSIRAQCFVQAAYDAGWVQPFDWASWRDSAEARRLLTVPTGLDEATPAQLSRVLTAVIRQDRFCDGVLLAEFQNGLMAGVARRAAALVDTASDGR